MLRLIFKIRVLFEVDKKKNEFFVLFWFVCFCRLEIIKKIFFYFGEYNNFIGINRSYVKSIYLFRYKEIVCIYWFVGFYLGFCSLRGL